jgi:hypothetical protein
MNNSIRDEYLKMYWRAFKETTDDDQRKALFLHIAGVVQEEQKLAPSAERSLAAEPSAI